MKSADEAVEYLAEAIDTAILSIQDGHIEQGIQTLKDGYEQYEKYVAEAADEANNEVGRVFEYWKAVMGKNAAARLTDKRRRQIQKARKHYSLEECFRAIDGCAMSEFHMGDNPSGIKYNDIELIFRDDSKTDRFLEIYEDTQEKPSDIGEWLGD